MSDGDDGLANPPELPITTIQDAPPAPKSGRPGAWGWKIATGVFALTTVGALAWGITQTDSLQGQVDSLQATVEQHEDAGHAASKIARSQIETLDEQVAELSAALEVLEQQAGDALEGAATEYAQVEKRLRKTKRAVAALEKELSRASTDAAAIASAYEKAQSDLSAAQTAMADLLAAVLGEVDGTDGF